MDRPRQGCDHPIRASLRCRTARRRAEDRSGCADRPGWKLRLSAGRTAPALRGAGRRRLLRRWVEWRRAGSRGGSTLPLGGDPVALEIAPRADALFIELTEIARSAAAVAAPFDGLPSGQPVTKAQPAADGAFGFFVHHRVESGRK